MGKRICSLSTVTEIFEGGYKFEGIDINKQVKDCGLKDGDYLVASSLMNCNPEMDN